MKVGSILNSVTALSSTLNIIFYLQQKNGLIVWPFGEKHQSSELTGDWIQDQNSVLGEDPLKMCPGECSIAVNSHHDYSNFFKGKYFIESGLQFHRFSLLLSWQEAWQYAYGAREVSESSTSELGGRRKRKSWAWPGILKP